MAKKKEKVYVRFVFARLEKQERKKEPSVIKLERLTSLTEYMNEN